MFIEIHLAVFAGSAWTDIFYLDHAKSDVAGKNRSSDFDLRRTRFFCVFSANASWHSLIRLI